MTDEFNANPRAIMNAMHHAGIATASPIADDDYYTSLDAAMEAADQMRLFVARLLAAMSSAE